MKVRITYILVVLGFLLLSLCIFPPIIVELTTYTVIGWCFFLARVTPDIEVGGSGVATAIVSLILLTVGVHAFCSWLMREMSSHEDDPARARQWKRSWTAAIVSGIVVIFCAGLSMVGATHQVGWLFSEDRILVFGSEASSRVQSRNNLKQIGLAMHNYHDTFGTFPPGATFDRYGEPMHSWQTLLLPYVDQQHLFERIDLATPWKDPQNAEPFSQTINVYSNPGIRSEPMHNEDGYALSHYAGNSRIINGGTSRKLKDIPDGSSQTILAGEVGANFQPWGSPFNWRDPAQGINQSSNGFGGSWKSRGAQFLLADGSVHFVSNDVDPQVLKALSTPAGSEDIDKEP